MLMEPREAVNPSLGVGGSSLRTAILRLMRTLVRGWLSQRLLLGTILFVVFVLCDLALFGWLIFRSLSQREINQVILEARSEAEELASQIAGEAERSGHDLYTAIATESETQTYIDSVLSQRDIVERVEIYDNEQRLVFRNERRETQGEAGEVDAGELPPPQVVTEQFDRQRLFERVEVPVGEFGTFVIGISRVELEERLTVLRRELMRQASVIGALTIVLFVSAYLLIWRLMRRAQRLEEKALEAERLAYVGTLASGLAHEIRSPLNSLNLNMQMLEEEVDEGGAVSSSRLMRITRSEISRLERLVTDFLSYAQPRPPELEEVRPGSLLEHVRDVLRGQIQTHEATVRIDEKCSSERIAVDRAQMNQLLLNLVQNALQATRATDRSAEIRLGVDVEGDEIVLSVADNGVGLTEEQAERMFELFYSKRKGGTGLGLAIVDRIARAHEASVEVDSNLGAGTTVRIRLPIVAEAKAKAPPRPRLEGPRSQGLEARRLEKQRS